MKRNGFSMIELVFVIVILGVLAAVAVPRFVTSTISTTSIISICFASPHSYFLNSPSMLLRPKSYALCFLL